LIEQPHSAHPPVLFAGFAATAVFLTTVFGFVDRPAVRRRIGDAACGRPQVHAFRSNDEDEGIRIVLTFLPDR
jgi:hypothetical protein